MSSFSRMLSISTVIVPRSVLASSCPMPNPKLQTANPGGADSQAAARRSRVVSGAVGAMVPQDVFELTGVADPRLRPGGRVVAGRDEDRLRGARPQRRV